MSKKEIIEDVIKKVKADLLKMGWIEEDLNTPEALQRSLSGESVKWTRDPKHVAVLQENVDWKYVLVLMLKDSNDEVVEKASFTSYSKLCCILDALAFATKQWYVDPQSFWSYRDHTGKVLKVVQCREDGEPLEKYPKEELLITENDEVYVSKINSLTYIKRDNKTYLV